MLLPASNFLAGTRSMLQTSLRSLGRVRGGTRLRLFSGVGINTSHQDSARKNVGHTAHFTASLRGFEHNRADALFSDPYASLLAGELGAELTSKLFEFKDSIRVHGVREGTVTELRSIPAGLVECISVRTAKIDATLQEYMGQMGQIGQGQMGQGYQICCLGAGLDTRPWRLAPPSPSSPSPSSPS
ncbi:hypothetical protein B484DRAFT_423603, partial [Ochromonadaceae sp. CCMP2298]